MAAVLVSEKGCITSKTADGGAATGARTVNVTANAVLCSSVLIRSRYTHGHVVTSSLY